MLNYVNDPSKQNVLQSKIRYTKENNPDGSIEYTISYKKGIETLPNLTKILVNENNEISAYINIQMISPLVESQFREWQWFGIQEFHPELIGDFTHVFKNEQLSRYNGVSWTYEQEKHLYTLKKSNLFIQEWSFRILPAIPRQIELDGQKYDIEMASKYGRIATQRNFLDEEDICKYFYNTHPSEPVPFLRSLTEALLIKDGVIEEMPIKDEVVNQQKTWVQKACGLVLGSR